MASLARTGLITIILAGLVLVVFQRVMWDRQQQAIDELEALNAEMEQRLEAHRAMIERLSRSRRIAHLRVTDQTVGPDGRPIETRVEFIELDDDGTELARQVFGLPGGFIFVDAWTVKFDHELVAAGHAMRGRSLVLLRRVYSERMPPAAGFAIDTPGAVPPGYAAGDVGHFEKQVWEGFWRLATDPEAAAALGVRVAQGEVVYKPIAAGETYELIVDAAGGMSLVPLPRGEPGADADDAAFSRAGG